MELLMALGSITLIDLILSGDNAVVIALASRNLPPHQRKKAVIWGCAGAVFLRIVLTVVATMLLKIPFVQFFGGLALLYIAIHLLVSNKTEVSCKEADCLWGAIKVIMVADAIMSLDNVLAIAGVANGHFGLLLAGLAISIPFVVFGSQMLVKLMDLFPAIVYVGSGILSWTSAKMMISDAIVGAPFAPYAIYFEVTSVLLVLGTGWYLRNSKVTQEA